MLPELPDYTNFAAINPADWEKAILKELKGQPLSSLEWEIEPGVQIGPLQLGEGNAPAPMPTLPCSPLEHIVVSDVAEANATALTALEGGVRALEFELQYALSDQEWGLLLNGLQMEFISIHFSGQPILDHIADANTAIRKIADVNGFDWRQLRGSFACRSDHNWSLETLGSLLPGYQCCVCMDPLDGFPSEKVASLLGQAQRSFQQARDLGVAPKDWQHRIYFEVPLSNLYYVELGRIRALRWLWSGLLDEMGISREEQIPAIISGKISASAYGPDAHDNLIRSACIGIIGMAGGCERLNIAPVQADGKITERFSRRMARNVIHLLQLESYLDKVQDPAAGSYYLEAITTALAQSAWNQYQAKLGLQEG